MIASVAFTHASIFFQRWQLLYATSSDISVYRAGKASYNYPRPAISTLAYDMDECRWQFSQGDRLEFFDHRPNLPSLFIQFGPEDSLASPLLHSQGPAAALKSLSTRPQPASHGLGAIELVSLEVANQPSKTISREERRRCWQNVAGPLPRSHVSLANVIVEILGDHSSKACDCSSASHLQPV